MIGAKSIELIALVLFALRLLILIGLLLILFEGLITDGNLLL